jgi:hypothetical protein
MSPKLIGTSDWRKTPSSEYRFFLYDPEGDGLMFFKAAEIRDAIAAEGIRLYCNGDGWSEEVGCVCAGEVTARAQATNVQKKPTRDEFETEEAFEDALEEWPGGDFDETCTFELLPLTAK